MFHQSARFSFLKISALGNPGRGLTRGSIGWHCARATCPFKKKTYSPVDHCPPGKFTPLSPAWPPQAFVLTALLEDTR